MKFWLADRDIIDGRSLYQRPMVDAKPIATGLDAILIGFLGLILVGIGAIGLAIGLFILIAIFRGFTGW